MPDEQRGVEVAQFVKTGPAARPYRADGRAPDLAGEGSAPQRPSVLVGEHESVGVVDGEALNVCSERVDDDLWQRDGAGRGGGLGRGKEWRAAGEQDQLLVDPQGAGGEDEAVVDHAEALALAQPGTGGEHDEGAVARRDAVASASTIPTVSGKTTWT